MVTHCVCLQHIYNHITSGYCYFYFIKFCHRGKRKTVNRKKIHTKESTYILTYSSNNNTVASLTSIDQKYITLFPHGIFIIIALVRGPIIINNYWSRFDWFQAKAVNNEFLCLSVRWCKQAVHTSPDACTNWVKKFQNPTHIIMNNLLYLDVSGDS